MLAVLGMVLLTACGGEGAEEGRIEISGVDYGFSGVPDTAAVGSELTFVNDSEAEVHELVAVRIADDEDRPLEELLELPDEETDGVVEFLGVLVALPAEAGANPEGEGDSIVLSQPGRYAIVCFIPHGADPAVVEEAMAGGTEGPPDMGDGTPHAFLGMTAEFEVEG